MTFFSPFFGVKTLFRRYSTYAVKWTDLYFTLQPGEWRQVAQKVKQESLKSSKPNSELKKKKWRNRSQNRPRLDTNLYQQQMDSFLL